MQPTHRPTELTRPRPISGDHYFHSTFNDLVLAGLVGLRAHNDHLEVHPLTLVGHFCARRLRLRGVEVDVVWDGLGTRYPHGAGLHVWMDGRLVGSAPPQLRSGSPAPQRLQISWDGRAFAACSRTKHGDGWACADESAEGHREKQSY